jgi:hypothetical protein
MVNRLCIKPTVFLNTAVNARPPPDYPILFRAVKKYPLLASLSLKSYPEASLDKRNCTANTDFSVFFISLVPAAAINQYLLPCPPQYYPGQQNAGTTPPCRNSEKY